jgi:hypothetical protein
MEPTRAYTMGGWRIRDAESNTETEIIVKIPDGALLIDKYFTYGGSLITKFIYPHFGKLIQEEK